MQLSSKPALGPASIFRRIVWALLVVVTSIANVWGPADAKLTEGRFSALDRAPSGDIVFVDIDSASIASVSQWPWPRSVHARLLDRLMAWGAYEVAFDIDFSTPSSPREDAAFADSLERAGGYAFLAAFRQGSATGREVVNTPIPEFAQHARSVLVNVDGLEGGQVRSIPASLPSVDAQSIAVQYSGRPADTDTIRIDFGIDLTKVPHVSATAVLDGTADPALIKDRQVVVGASAIELHDLFNVPRFGVISGPLVQIAAAETVKQSRALVPAGIWPALALAALLLIGWPQTIPLRLTVVSAVGLMVAAEALSLGVLWAFRVDVASTPFHVACLCLITSKFMIDRAQKRRQIDVNNQQFAYLATHDERTGALSRTAFLELVQQWVGTGSRPTIILWRIERFDLVEASLGHDVSEAAIGQFYARLNAIASGSVGRVESHIFAVAFEEPVETEQIEQMLWRLAMPYIVGEHRLVLNTRWGSARMAPGHSAATTIHQSRMALAVAGENKVPGLAFAEDYSSQLNYRQSLDIALRHAQSQGELSVLFQAQVDIRTNRVVGAEALLRWNSLEYGLVSPADFIPLAEENGTIVQLGAWIMHEACRQAMDLGWPGRIAVNVSPIQFQHSDVLDMVKSALTATGFPASRLDVEITEGAFEDSALVASLDALRGLGVGIAIDDFGTGYSSLSRLASLPIDKLKIDQSFVRAMTDRRSEAVVESILSLAAKLGHHVVVEGIETAEQLASLEGFGSPTVQGYLFGRPAKLASLLVVPTTG